MTGEGFSAADWCAWARGERRDGRTARALAGFRRALALDPALRAAKFELAAMLLDGGDLDGAGALMAQMAAVARDRPDVLWLQARLAMARQATGVAREALARLLRVDGLAAAQRAEALLLQGLALDADGDTAGAFAAAAQGKAIQRALHAAQAGGRESEVAKLRRLGRWIDAAPGWPAPTERPVAGAAASHVFLLGFPRSGTTLLEQVLAAHPDVRTLEEAPTLAVAYQAFLLDEPACARLLRLGDEEAAAWVGDYWRRVRAHGVDVAGATFVDKQPAGTLNLPIIARLFPHARILFARRDPRDVTLSCFRQPFALNAMTYAFTDLGEAAACYDACMTLAEHAQTRWSFAWADTRHEALVEDFEGELSRILAFLGLERHPAMADFVATANARAIRTPSASQVRAGLNRRGLARWRRYARELAPVLPVLAPWVERFGYPP